VKIKTDFYHRHTRYHEYHPGSYRIEEHFWLNREAEPRTSGSMLYCLAYGECVWQKGCSVSDQRHHRWSIEYIVEGNVDVQYRGNRYRLSEGDLLICPPDGKMTRSLRPDDFLRKRVVIIEGRMVEYLSHLKRLGMCVRLASDDRERLEEIYDAIKKVVTKGAYYLAADLNVLIYSLMSELSRMTESDKYPRVLHHAMQYIGRNLHQKLTLQSLSAECQTSVKTLSRLFNEYLQISPMHYIIDCRLERAKHLIALGDMSLKEIAYECGYSSESFFSRAFKQKYGFPPTTYRQLMGRQLEESSEAVKK